MRSELVTTDDVTAQVFDTVNVGFWDSVHCEYLAYIRDWRDGRRDIKTATPKDFSELVAVAPQTPKTL